MNFRINNKKYYKPPKYYSGKKIKTKVQNKSYKGIIIALGFEGTLKNFILVALFNFSSGHSGKHIFSKEREVLFTETEIYKKYNNTYNMWFVKPKDITFL